MLEKLGKAKWEQMIDTTAKMVMNNTWDVKSARITLRNHTSNRHVAQNVLERAAQNT